jgi:flagellar biosynthesis GTPase FlhF
MYLKRFRARTAEEALEAARRELGQDAVVLGTRTVPQRGWRGMFGARDFIVTAAAERVVSEDRPAEQELRHQFRERMGAAHAQLCAAGFDAAVIDEIATGLGNEIRTASPDVVRRAIATWAARISAPDDLEPAIEVFVGPAGAGKTTALLQVAATRAAKGARPVLVSTDPSQLGTVEPLRLHAALMGLRFIAARTAGQLDVALSEWRRPVLVDTVGCPSTNAASREVLSLIASTPGARVHLVTPAGTSSSALYRLIDSSRLVLPDRVLITKVEDANPVAALAEPMRSRNLRVSYLATGCRAPEDLHLATPELLAAALVGDSLTASEHAA